MGEGVSGSCAVPRVPILTSVASMDDAPSAFHHTQRGIVAIEERGRGDDADLVGGDVGRDDGMGHAAKILSDVGCRSGLI